MANKKVNQLTTKPAVNSTDLFLIADPTSGQAFKSTISALGAAIGSAVASVNGLVGVVVLDTDDIQELASPTNKWFTDTRARAALSAGTGISYNSGTGVISSSVTLADLGGVPTSRTLTINGTALDLSANRSWTIDAYVLPTATDTVLGGVKIGSGVTITSGVISVSTNYQAPLSGTGFVKISGSTISYDNSTYLTTSSASSTYLPLTGGSLTNSLSSGYVLSVTNTTAAAGANGLYVDIASGSTGTPFRVDRGGVSLITVNYLGATLLKSTITANQFIKSNGTSSEYLMADGSVSTGMSFTYPGAGIVVSTGSAWGTSITNNSTNWNTAYSWGNHAGLYLPLSGGTLTGALSGTSAMFSGDFAAGGNITSNKADSDTTYTGSQIFLSGTYTGIRSGTDHSFNVDTYNGGSVKNAFKIVQSGAATFSSSVQSSVLKLSDGTLSGAGNFEFTSEAFFGARFQSNAYKFMAGNNTSEYMRITSAGNVGIGTTSPSTLLEVYKSSGSSVIRANYNGTVTFDFTASSGGNAFLSTSNNAMIFETNSTERMRITSGGNVGIGTTSPANKLTVVGDIRGYKLFGGEAGVGAGNYTIFSNDDNVGYIDTVRAVNSGDFQFRFSGTSRVTISTGGNITATAFFESSDNRLKTLIEDNYQAKGIESITAKLYTKNGVTELGYYAQDVQGILPSAVATGADGFLNLSYREVHTAKIARLEKRVEELEAQLNLI